MTTKPKQPTTILMALHQVMASVGYVQKRDRNAFHKYNYASEAALLQVLRPAMVEAGLLLIPSAKEASDIDQYGNIHVTVEYTLAHRDGEVWPEKIVAMGSGNDRNSKGGVGDKGLYKALTGANKYMLFKLFQIETGDDPEKTEQDAAAPDNKPANGAPARTGSVKRGQRKASDKNGGNGLELISRDGEVVEKFTQPDRGDRVAAFFTAFDQMIEAEEYKAEAFAANEETCTTIIKHLPDWSERLANIRNKADVPAGIPTDHDERQPEHFLGG